MTNEDKYRWHDLRKNPDDLPEKDPDFKNKSLDVVIETSLNTHYIGNYSYAKRQWNFSDGQEHPVEVIVWRHLWSFEQVREAIEKQIPKKPIDTDYVRTIYDENGMPIEPIYLYKAVCPVCGTEICNGELEKSDLEQIHFCDNCGQALDWTE